MFDHIKPSVKTAPPRIVLYGVDGIGKSTFAASSPSPLFICAEETGGLLKLSRAENKKGEGPKTIEEVSQYLIGLRDHETPFKTLVIDSVDWLEPMVFEKVCRDDRVVSIEKVGGGYGKGYTAALDLWRVLLSQIDEVRRKRGIAVILIAHAQMKQFHNPEGEDYDRYNLKLNEKAAGLIREWADAVLFAQWEVFVESKDGKRAKATPTNRRLVHTVEKPAFYAKNRYGLSPQIELGWEHFSAAMSHATRDLDAVKASIAALLPRVDDETRTKAEAYLLTLKETRQFVDVETRLKEVAK